MSKIQELAKLIEIISNLDDQTKETAKLLRLHPANEEVEKVFFRVLTDGIGDDLCHGFDNDDELTPKVFNEYMTLNRE